MDKSQVPIVSSDYIAEEFEGETLLYSAENEKAVYLNETAHLILALCQKNLSVEEIISLLQDQYPEHSMEIEKDVLESLETLVNQGIITFDDD